MRALNPGLPMSESRLFPQVVGDIARNLLIGRFRAAIFPGHAP